MIGGGVGLMKIKEERVVIEKDGEKVEFIVRELTYGEASEVLKKSFTSGGRIKMLAREVPQAEIDLFALRDNLILKAVRHGDGRPLTEDELYNMSASVCEELFVKAMELNPIFRISIS